MRRVPAFLALSACAAVSACAAPPPDGPTVMALPPQGKPFEVFQQDDFTCRGFAQQQTGYNSQIAGNNAAVGSAVVGTALGAGLGAAIGAAAGAPGPGAAVGAAAGLLAGSSVGAGNAQAIGVNAQVRYDTAYTQCMYAHGNAVQSAPTGFAGGYGGGGPYGGYGGYPGVGIGIAPTVVVGGGWGWGGGWGGGWRGGGWGGGWHGGGWYR
jgi:Glycine-zipper domain